VQLGHWLDNSQTEKYNNCCLRCCGRINRLEVLLNFPKLSNKPSHLRAWQPFQQNCTPKRITDCTSHEATFNEHVSPLPNAENQGCGDMRPRLLLHKRDQDEWWWNRSLLFQGWSLLQFDFGHLNERQRRRQHMSSIVNCYLGIIVISIRDVLFHWDISGIGLVFFDHLM
jgi:hypothetical protein